MDQGSHLIPFKPMNMMQYAKTLFNAIIKLSRTPSSRIQLMKQEKDQAK